MKEKKKKFKRKIEKESVKLVGSSVHAQCPRLKSLFVLLLMFKMFDFSCLKVSVE